MIPANKTVKFQASISKFLFQNLHSKNNILTTYRLEFSINY